MPHGDVPLGRQQRRAIAELIGVLVWQCGKELPLADLK
jgi:hypothetical protein